MPDMGVMILIAIVLFLGILLPFLIIEIRRGKRSGRFRWTRQKPVGHSDLGDDSGRGPGGSTGAPRGSMPEGSTHEDAGARPGPGATEASVRK